MTAGSPAVAPLGALLRLSASPFGIRPAPVRACVSRCQAGRQRAPRTGAVLPPGRVPKPPGRPADEAGRAGAAQANALALARDRLPDLRPRIPLAPSTQRHRLTPLDEQGALWIIL